MDITKYENSIPRPNKSEFYVTIKATAPSGKVHEVKVFEEEPYREAMRAYKNEENRLLNSFREDLLEELGITNHPKAELLMSKAWEHGHSGGYNDVVYWAWEFVDFLRD